MPRSRRPPGINSRTGSYHRLVDDFYRLVDGFVRTRIGAWIVMHVFSPLDSA